ncbi:MAG: xanthine dehydrogenase accessory protein XdhC [Burkholderiales bacterium]|nr:MAG: xanthine dehydrogenase accessory protein XdhC [Burkholderiales bacterium]TAG82622.1 MAG: xanthine dehydrogenase accessory protein XdhC [Betaproteobacteria bacterium]
MLLSARLELLLSLPLSVWVIVADAKGSTPRDVGASMIVTPDQVFDTIGGGHLELKAIEFAREQLANERRKATVRHFPLGPSLGQCCGGHTSLLFAPCGNEERAMLEAMRVQAAQDEAVVFSTSLDTGEPISVPLANDAWHIVIFGAGHVGKALVNVLANLPCQITWIDAREAEFPAMLPHNVTALASDDPASEVSRLPTNSQVLVLTHSHAIDLEICFALLKRDDFAYCGLIGSHTKAATFRRRFQQRAVPDAAIARIICPIGSISSAAEHRKHPGVIAISVAADLVARRGASAKQHSSATP